MENRRTLEISLRHCRVCLLTSLFLSFFNCRTSLSFTFYGWDCQDSLVLWKPHKSPGILLRNARGESQDSTSASQRSMEWGDLLKERKRMQAAEQTADEHDTRGPLRQTWWCEHAVMLEKPNLQTEKRSCVHPAAVGDQRGLLCLDGALRGRCVHACFWWQHCRRIALPLPRNSLWFYIRNGPQTL